MKLIGESCCVYYRNRFCQHGFINPALGGNSARGQIASFLYIMTGMSFHPFPRNRVAVNRLVKTGPPLVICLSSKASRHRLDNVPRVRPKPNNARLAERFESQRSGRDLGLLIRGGTKIFAKGAPFSAIPKYCNRRRSCVYLAVAQAGTVTIDGNLLQCLNPWEMSLTLCICFAELEILLD
jgi:hypothetical protein